MIIDKIIIDYNDYNSICIIIIVNAKEVQLMIQYSTTIDLSQMYSQHLWTDIENIYIEQI